VWYNTFLSSALHLAISFILWPLYLRRKSLQFPFVRRLEGIKASKNVKLLKKKKLRQIFRLLMWCNWDLYFVGYVFCHWVFVARNFETSSSSVGCPTLLDQYLRKLCSYLENWTLAVSSVAYHWVIMAHVLLLFCILGVRWGWVLCYCSLKWAKYTRQDDGWVWSIGGMIRGREILKC